jgi:DNA-binding winged helix-turn-helix (wHTH) protein
VLEFGGFRLYPQQRLLLENDTAIEVPGRAMDILIALAERAGEVVSKDELLASAWPGCEVQIEKSLRRKSPENGNISNIGRRLSADSRVSCSFSVSGDISQNARKPVFCGLFAT